MDEGSPSSSFRPPVLILVTRTNNFTMLITRFYEKISEKKQILLQARAISIKCLGLEFMVAQQEKIFERERSMGFLVFLAKIVAQLTYHLRILS